MQGATIVDQIVSISAAENYVPMVEEVSYVLQEIIQFMGLTLVILTFLFLIVVHAASFDRAEYNRCISCWRQHTNY